MIYGYARISDKSQQILPQVEELKAFGCEEIVEEVITGISKEKELNKLIEKLQPNDTLVVIRVDRLGRNTLQLLQLIEELEKKQANLVVKNLGMDTRTPIGKAVFAILSAFAEMERSDLKIKQKNGIESAKKRGVHLGRKPNFTKEGLQLAINMYDNGKYTVSEIEAATQVSRATLYRTLKQRNKG